MKAIGSLVRGSGLILMTGDFERFRNEIARVVGTLAGEAVLKGLDPGIELILRMRSMGHIEGVIDMTPDHLNQQHCFNVEADQSYFPALVSSCDAILDRFPCDRGNYAIGG